jgi:hypothetical protein
MSKIDIKTLGQTDDGPGGKLINPQRRFVSRGSIRRIDYLPHYHPFSHTLSLSSFSVLFQKIMHWVECARCVRVSVCEYMYWCLLSLLQRFVPCFRFLVKRSWTCFR